MPGFFVSSRYLTGVMKNILTNIRVASGTIPLGVIIAVTFIVAAAIPLAARYWTENQSTARILQSAAHAALLEYDAETAELEQPDSKAARVRPIIVGYELLTNGVRELRLLLLFPSDTWSPTFGVRFSERVPVSPQDSISESYAESAPAIVHSHGFFPAGSVGHFTVRPPKLANLNKTKALELFDAEFRPLGVVPVRELNTAFILPRCMRESATSVWQPLLRFYGAIPCAWLASPDGLPMFAPMEAGGRRLPRVIVEMLLREETNRPHCGYGRVVKGVAK